MTVQIFDKEFIKKNMNDIKYRTSYNEKPQQILSVLYTHISQFLQLSSKILCNIGRQMTWGDIVKGIFITGIASRAGKSTDQRDKEWHSVLCPIGVCSQFAWWFVGEPACFPLIMGSRRTSKTCSLNSKGFGFYLS